MLVLSRKPNEYIDIIKDGEVLLSFSIVDVRDSKVRLGFDAPPELIVLRGGERGLGGE